jgi:hypothetical protein
MPQYFVQILEDLPNVAPKIVICFKSVLNAGAPSFSERIQEVNLNGLKIAVVLA